MEIFERNEKWWDSNDGDDSESNSSKDDFNVWIIDGKEKNGVEEETEEGTSGNLDEGSDYGTAIKMVRVKRRQKVVGWNVVVFWGFSLIHTW